ncbi:MAG TPA: purine-nucleoside phosphorylase [Trinickia sp.]|nr:purine-nucleoside phosphorylase [Trinickia sp.]
MPSLSHHLTLTTNFLRKQVKLRPKVALILGSGLGGLADGLEGAVAFAYKDLPSFPVTTVPGHRGRLIIGKLRGVPVVVFDGRMHLYEGLPMWQVAYPVYVARQLGASSLIVTNAAGGINPAFRAGAIMIIRDHINLTGSSPLTGENDPELGARFPSMRGAYDTELRVAAHQIAAEQNVPIVEGVYAAVLGPSYETDAELRMLSTIGADAVGMSTVPEVIAARHAGLRVAGISVISNDAKPDQASDTTHEDVQSVVQSVAARVRVIIEGLVERAGA